MSYSLSTIWYERHRFLPAILAVSFSAALVAVQAGLVLGLLTMMSLPVDRATADVWVGYPGVKSVDLGHPIPERWLSRLDAQPEVVQTETAVLGFSPWTRTDPTTGTTTMQVVSIIGTRLEPNSLAAVEQLRRNPDLLVRLAEPQTVVIDQADIHRLGIRHVGETAEVMGVRVRVVGFVQGCRSLGGPYVFCSRDTARAMLHYQPGQVTYLVAKCYNAEDSWKVARRMEGYPQLVAFTSDEFSARSRMHWLTTTKAGIAIGFTALLGLLVGAVVTSQTLYAATAASQREYATLRAMGIPRWRLKLSVLVQSFWVGLFGIILAAPITFALAEAANAMGTRVRLHPVILVLSVLVTLSMAIGSGLAALRSFQQVDPAHNLR